MIFLVNAPKGAKTKRGKSAQKKRKKVKARRSSLSLSKTRRKGAPMAAKKRAKRKVVRRAKTVRRKRRVTARKRKAVTTLRRGAVYQTNGRRRKARRSMYRRNPGGGILNTVMRTGGDALAVIGGVALTNVISRRIPFGEGNKGIEIAKKVAVALGIGMVAQKVSSRALAEKLVVGGMVAVGMDLLRNVPMVGTALSGDDDLRMMARVGMSAYPSVTDGGMSAWVEPGVQQNGALSGYYN